MHPVVNHLLQLQELTLIRDEQKVVQGTHRLDELDKSIKAMAKVLPMDIGKMYDKLSNRDKIVVVPVPEGICAGCGMSLPISLVQMVRMEKEIHACPNCARVLYSPAMSVKRTGKAPRRTAPRKVGIARFSAHGLVVPELQAETKEEAIRELASRMETEAFVDSGEKLVELALQREAVVCTGVDHGLAFPHVRGVEGGGLALALGISHKGIKFDPDSDDLSHIIFFLVIPTAASAFYLKLLAGLTETFMAEAARKALLAETDQQKLWKALVKLTRSAIK